VEVSIENLILHDRVGEGTQSEVLLAELPGSRELVAVKLGLKHGAVAREAPVLKAMAGTPGFPKLLHHEADGPLAPGGYLVMELLGPSLDDLRKGESLSESPCLSGPTFLRVGRGVIGLLRELHLAGFVHNDVKPANVLLGKGAEVEPRRLHLIDFGSCTSSTLARAPHAASNGDLGEAAESDLPASGPIGTLLFASVGADEGSRPMRPADDIESLFYTLAFLAAGSLPWKGKPEAVAVPMKRQMLANSDAAAEMIDDVHCATAVTALRALWAEVVRCHGDGGEGSAGASVDYEACLAALGGGSSKVEAVSELSIMAALGGGSGVEAEGGIAGVFLAQPSEFSTVSFFA